jgi:tetrahydromethanopterin S-methyltransferase subunit B
MSLGPHTLVKEYSVRTLADMLDALKDAADLVSTLDRSTTSSEIYPDHHRVRLVEGKLSDGSCVYDLWFGMEQP